MKLHFNKTWARKFDKNEISPEATIGANNNVEAAIAMIGKKELLSNWKNFPIGEIAERKWIDIRGLNIKKEGQQVLNKFLDMVYLNIPTCYPMNNVHWRKTTTKQTEQSRNIYSLVAWSLHVLFKADTIGTRNKYRDGSITNEFLTTLAKLSKFGDGPLQARDYLDKAGIILIIEPGLSNSQLDGASLLSRTGNPVIGMTLLRDRIDNFWFTLFHELFHVQRHLNNQNPAFFDDLEQTELDDQKENEADRLASDALIPRSIFHRSKAFRLKSRKAVIELASQLEIHPAIVAGRIRKVTNNYAQLTNMVGHGEVRPLFLGELKRT